MLGMILHKKGIFGRYYSFDLEEAELDVLLKIFLKEGWRCVKKKQDTLPLNSVYSYSFVKKRRTISVLGDTGVVNIVVNRVAFRELKSYFISAINEYVEKDPGFNCRRTLKLAGLKRK